MLGEHGEPTHGFFIYDAAVHIPMILAGPGLPSRVVPDQVRIVDVMPTALELLGVTPPTPVQGASLMPLARGQRRGLQAYSESWYPRYHYGWSELVSVQDGRFQQTVTITPEFGTGHLYLAKALLNAGDLEGAERSARAELHANADPKIAPLGHYVLADVFNRRGRSQEAAREAAAARRLERAGLSPRGARAPRGESP